MKKLFLCYHLLFKHWMRLNQKIRFILVGGYNTCFSYALYALFVYLGMNPHFSLMLSFFLSSFNSYFTQKFYVFNTKGHYISEYLKCLTTWAGSYFINMLLLILFLEILNFNPYLAEFFALVILTIYSFIALKYFAFTR